jgi:hypothetical protein
MRSLSSMHAGAGRRDGAFNPGLVPNPIYWFDLNHNLSTAGSIITVGSRFGSDLSLTMSGAASSSIEAGGLNGRVSFIPPASGSVNVLSGTTAAFTQAQPWTTVTVGRWHPNTSWAFVLHTTTALSLYCENTVGIAQWAGTVRSAFNPTSNGYANLPFICIAVMNGASSYLRCRTHGLADATFSVPGTVGTGSLSGTKRWGRSTSNSQGWQQSLATEALFAGVMSTPDQDYLLDGLSSYYGIVPAP